jgi:hypothetical protein
MPYQLDWEEKGIYWKYYGSVTGKEVVEASTSIYSDPRFDTLKYKLVDFLDAENIDIEQEQVALIAYQHRSAQRSNPYIKNAIVVSAEGGGLAKKFASFFDNSFWEVKVFHDLDEANKWLGRKAAA